MRSEIRERVLEAQREKLSTVNSYLDRIKGIVEGLRLFAGKDKGLLTDNIDVNARIEGSTGPGLSIVYRIVEGHCGTISVRSKLDIGTTFTIIIPVR